MAKPHWNWCFFVVNHPGVGSKAWSIEYDSIPTICFAVFFCQVNGFAMTNSTHWVKSIAVDLNLRAVSLGSPATRALMLTETIASLVVVLKAILYNTPFVCICSLNEFFCQNSRTKRKLTKSIAEKNQWEHQSRQNLAKQKESVVLLPWAKSLFQLLGHSFLLSGPRFHHFSDGPGGNRWAFFRSRLGQPLFKMLKHSSKKKKFRKMVKTA